MRFGSKATKNELLPFKTCSTLFRPRIWNSLAIRASTTLRPWRTRGPNKRCSEPRRNFANFWWINGRSTRCSSRMYIHLQSARGNPRSSRIWFPSLSTIPEPPPHTTRLPSTIGRGESTWQLDLSTTGPTSQLAPSCCQRCLPFQWKLAAICFKIKNFKVLLNAKFETKRSPLIKFLKKIIPFLRSKAWSPLA